jgi:murein DD-endopeptidase MepM/ murein hydrolase activator NlpD
MTTRAVASVRKFFQTYFPERHLYHRSRGTVQFIVLSAPAQIALLTLSLGFFGWVAYASVNVVFKDQIIAAKEKHFQTMQAAYENRIAEMQASLDDIHTALIATQDRFASAAGELEERHRQLSQILARHDAALKDLNTLKTRITHVYRNLDTSGDGNRLVMSGEEAEPRLREPRNDADGQGGPEMSVAAPSADKDLPADKDFAPADKPDVPIVPVDEITKKLPAPLAASSRGIAGRFGTLDSAQHSMIEELDGNARQAGRGMERIVSMTGLNVDRVLEQVVEDDAADGSKSKSTEGIGGPFVPLAALAPFTRKNAAPLKDEALDTLKASVDRMVGLEEALSVIPLVGPLEVSFHVASGFGRRVDPFTGQAAFHYGLDFVAPLTSPVLATSAGIVTMAGRQGPYGNLVEVDHGHGLRTRYGHLYQIKVKVGDVVKFHQVVGLLGSTGRSTGPHVHYEVRFNGTLRDPARFLEAGRYVFQG